jgi:hypothetical protein
MFGFGNSPRRGRSGTFSTSNLTKAALAGAGLLAAKWWRNRQSTNRPTQRTEQQPEVNSSSPRGF